jgi:hypothetical protein
VLEQVVEVVVGSPGFSNMSIQIFQGVLIIIVVLLLGWSLLAYYRTRIKSLLYMGIGGMVVLCGWIVDSLNSPKGLPLVLFSAGIFLLGWGLSRGLTIDSVLLKQYRKVEFANWILCRNLSGSVAQGEHPLPSSGNGITLALLMFFAAMLMWFVWPHRIVSTLIFMLFGVQIMMASLIYLKKK